MRGNAQRNAYTILGPVFQKSPIESFHGFAIGTNVVANYDVLSLNSIPVEGKLHIPATTDVQMLLRSLTQY